MENAIKKIDTMRIRFKNDDEIIEGSPSFIISRFDNIKMENLDEYLKNFEDRFKLVYGEELKYNTETEFLNACEKVGLISILGKAPTQRFTILIGGKL